MIASDNVLSDLGYDVIQNWLKENCQSYGGKKLSSTFFNYNNLELKNELDLTDEIINSFERKDLSLDINIPSIKIWIKLLAIKGSQLSNNHFNDLYNLLELSKKLKKKCNSHNFPKWNEKLNNIIFFNDGQKEILKIFNDQFEIKDSASSNLKKIRKSINLLKSQTQKKLNSIFLKAKTNNWLKNDQLIWKDDRLMIPLDVTHKRKIKGIIHSYSSTRQTAFVEPIEIIEDNNKLNSLYQDETNEVNKILISLGSLFYPYIKEIKNNYNLLILFDYHTSKALFSKKFNCCRPTFNKQNLVFLNAKNPILLITNKTVVDLNFSMNENKILLISGPNAGGKTVAIKTIGLFVLMAQQGLPLPAKKFTAPLFKKIQIDIGDRQSIDNDLSTFSAHIKNLINILNNADTDTLILLDELGTGTEPEAGTALSQSILEDLINKGSFVFATTHMSALKFWAQEKQEITNAGMIFDNKNIKPTFELQLGLPGSSFALEISNRLGLDKKIIDRAKSLMNKGILKSDNLIEKLELKNQSINALNKKIEHKTITIEQKEQELLKKEQKITNIFNNAEKLSLEKSQETLINYRKEIEKLINNIKINQASKDSIKEAKNHISSQIKKITKKQKNSPIKINKTDLIIGKIVSVPDFNAKGRILSINEKKNNVILDINGKKITLNTNQLFIEKNQTITKKESKNISKFSISKPTSFKIDLRGKRVDAAIEDVKLFLDQTYISGMKFIHIIHGKGTGALQNSIHEELKNIKYIDSYNYADANNGGTGVTIVEFDN